MSLDTIENIWLVIGTDNKKNKLISHRQGRLPLGEKGIGRLGVHKLGNDIKLYSKHSDENEVYVSIDWSKLAESKLIPDPLSEIDISINETKISKLKSTTHFVAPAS